ncbi:MAG: OsmC family protein [Anaerolineae bacterium]
MPDSIALDALQPDAVFDGGDLDCGSGLILLIREHMLQAPVGGVLEMRSREPSVGDDLPPWCRMVGHDYLGALPDGSSVRYFMRRGAGASEDARRLEEDKRKAQEYVWRVRVRATGPLESTVYCRNFSWRLGQPASFEERDPHPSAVEALLGALAASLATGFATTASRDGLNVDDIEIATSGRLENVLALLGLDEGDSSFSIIEVKGFASTMDDEDRVRAAWDKAVRRSPLVATLAKAVTLKIRLTIV